MVTRALDTKDGNGDGRLRWISSPMMDKLSDWLDRYSCDATFIKPRWMRSAGSSFSVGPFSDLLTKNWFCSPKITTDFKKAGSSFSDCTKSAIYQASSTVIECLWHFSFLALGYYQPFSGWYYQYWPDRLMFSGQKIVPSHQRAFHFLCSSMHK